MRKFILFLLLGFSGIVSAQHTKQEQFKERVVFAATLLMKQPDAQHIQACLSDGFTLDSISAFNYYLKDPQGNPMTVYLHIETRKIVYIEFTEPKCNFSEMNKLLTERGFEWIGSEHLWDYFNDKRFAISISPQMTVHVSKYDL